MPAFLDCINKNEEIVQGPPDHREGDAFSFAGQKAVADFLTWKYSNFATEMHKNAFFQLYKASYERRAELCYWGLGIYGRSAFWNQWFRMSRDQMSANTVAMGFFGMRWTLIKSYFFLLTRLSFGTNCKDNDDSITGWRSIRIPELWGPRIHAGYIRGILGKASILLYPLLCILDLELLVGAYIKKHQGDDQTNNETNYICFLVQAKEICPTFISEWARRVYINLPCPGPYRKNHAMVSPSDFSPKANIDYFFEGRNDIEPPLHLFFENLEDSIGGK